jgi:hypothetical protein
MRDERDESNDDVGHQACFFCASPEGAEPPPYTDITVCARHWPAVTTKQR